MLDGRALRNYTAADCDAAADCFPAGDATGDWLRAVSRRIRKGWADAGDGYYASKTVGDVFTESELGLSFLMSSARQLFNWELMEQGGPPEVQPGDEITEDDIKDFDAKIAEAFHWKK
jgi:hypothetical protein